MPVIKDQIGFYVDLPAVPQRIVSLVPSQTELLYDLGLDKEVIGITKFCIHPDHWKKEKVIVGGTKNLNIEKIISLQPDLIIANKEENTKAQIEHLQNLFPTYTSDIATINEALKMIHDIGEILNKKLEAQKIITNIRRSFQDLQLPSLPKKVLYLIWKDPYITIGGDTFIHQLIQKLGVENITGNLKRYPEISIETMQTMKPDMVFLSSEPYPFKEKHLQEIKQLLPNSNVILVDGEMFSWYGSRLQHAANYLSELYIKIVG